MQEVLAQTNGTREMSKEEILLQAQVIELQIKCNSLAAINSKLINNMGHAQLNKEEEPEDRESKSMDNSCFAGDITKMQL